LRGRVREGGRSGEGTDDVSPLPRGRLRGGLLLTGRMPVPHSLSLRERVGVRDKNSVQIVID
jgi:hypothetical protein